jgi:hypothetical protein
MGHRGDRLWTGEAKLLEFDKFVRFAIHALTLLDLAGDVIHGDDAQAAL